jgi:eukaryotic-like serine/threonine-protein kinase
MAEALTTKLIELVKRSELVDDAVLESFLTKLAAEGEGSLPDNPDKLADRMVADGLLTEWQSKKLLAGKYKGFRLGKYKLLGEVGKGGMSAVYLAEHILMRRRVAIKVLPKTRVKDASYLDRFRLEARAVAKLDDPHIVRAFDIDNDGDTHYIVMEYVDGPDLHRVVSQNGPLDADTAADYIAQAATGLAHAHEKNLIHRDIKPANLLVDRTQTVKLLDLGLAKLTEDDGASLTLAHDENVLGTADYLAPEQALNSHGADERSDIYSLGCTLYYLLSGRPPFPEGTISERLLKHQVEEPESLLKVRPELPISLVEICNKMMAKRPELRFETADQVSERLTQWLADRGRKLRGGRIANEGDSGVGSGILTRYAIRPPSSKISPTPPSSETISNRASNVDTDRLNGSSGVDLGDEEITLAPLDDDPHQEKKSSDVLAADSGRLRSGPATSGPPSKSLFEEEVLEKVLEPTVRRHSGEFDYNPLHPPGFSSPYKKSSLPLFLALGVGALVLIAILVIVMQ